MGTTDHDLALRISLKFEDAARLARARQLVESAARKTIRDIYELVNGDRLVSSTVHDFLHSWLTSKEVESSARSVERYRVVINQFLRFLGPDGSKRDLIHLSPGMITEFRDELSTRVAGSTINFALKVLRSALNDARRQGLATTNAADLIKPVKYRKFRRQAFSVDEVKKVLLKANVEWRGMILLGVYCGLRLGDIAGLRWGAVVRIPTQTGQ